MSLEGICGQGFGKGHNSLFIAVVAAALDLVIGVLYGGKVSFYGGRLDNIMQRIIEVLVGIPNLIVIILFILIWNPGLLQSSWRLLSPAG